MYMKIGEKIGETLFEIYDSLFEWHNAPLQMPRKLETWEIESLYHRADLNHDGKIIGDELILFLRNEGLKVNIE